MLYVPETLTPTTGNTNSLSQFFLAMAMPKPTRAPKARVAPPTMAIPFSPSFSIRFVTTASRSWGPIQWNLGYVIFKPYHLYKG